MGTYGFEKGVTCLRDNLWGKIWCSTVDCVAVQYFGVSEEGYVGMWFI